MMRMSKHLPSPLLFAVLFAVLVLSFNADLFRVPIVEHSDFAANALQIQQAKVGKELLGNYSRWKFHHPGPALFYLLGAGEYLFHDVIHIAPAPMNAQLITVILLNIVVAFVAIELFQQHCPSFMFRPLAMAAMVWWISAINRTVPNGALVSAWMPHVALFVFLLFAVSAASVATGAVRHLPLLAFSGGLMTHLHVAQVLFVTVISATACAVALGREYRQWRPGEIWRRYKRTFLGVLAIVGLFALPVVLEVALHNPDNIDAIRSYLNTYQGQRNGIGVSLRYFFSFLLFDGDPHVHVPDSSCSLLSVAFSRQYPIIYWGVFFTALAAAVWYVRRDRKVLSPFLKAVLWECALISALFLIWASRISGELYNFNGFFIYSIQLIVWFSVVAIVGAECRWCQSASVVAVLYAAVLIAVVLASRQFKNTYTGSDEVRVIGGALLQTSGKVHLSFEPADWPIGVGVANYLTREHRDFCIDRDWGFMFGYQNVCATTLDLKDVALVRTPRECAPPCRTVIRHPLVVQVRAPRPRSFPIEIGLLDSADMKEGFYAPDGHHRWSQRKAAIRFLLAEDLGTAPRYRLRISGSVLPGRPAIISFNGRELGEIKSLWLSTATFLVEKAVLRPGGENQVSIYVANSGPVEADPRDLGFSFSGLVIEPEGVDVQPSRTVPGGKAN